MKKIICFIVALFWAANVFAQGNIISQPVDIVPERDFDHEVWGNAETETIPLNPQNLQNPTFNEPTVHEIKVHAIHNDETIGLMLEWEDETKNERLTPDESPDQVAIQVPFDADPPPSFMMGNRGGPVHILNWKAVWQKDIEEGFAGIKELYPNYWVDIYPMMESEGDGQERYPKELPLQDFLDKEEAKMFIPGVYAENPMSIYNREEPAEEAIAEGFGTLTSLNELHCTAWGTWKDGTWRVILTRPLEPESENVAPIPESTVISFAVWDGEAGNQGARKHYTRWVDLEISQ